MVRLEFPHGVIGVTFAEVPDPRLLDGVAKSSVVHRKVKGIRLRPEGRCPAPFAFLSMLRRHIS